MGKTRDLFKKIRDNQGNISCKDGLDKGQKWYGPNRSRRFKKRWQEYTEELYKLYITIHTIYNYTKKNLYDPENHGGVITQLEPDILECKFKWALGSITMNKARGVMEFQLNYFKSYKMML